MEIRKNEWYWIFSTILQDGMKCEFLVKKKYFPKYTRKPKGITNEVLIQLAARAIRNMKLDPKQSRLYEPMTILRLPHFQGKIFASVVDMGRLKMHLLIGDDV